MELLQQSLCRNSNRVSWCVFATLLLHSPSESRATFFPFFLSFSNIGKGDNGKKPLSQQAPVVVSPENAAIEATVVKELAALTQTLFLDEGTEPVVSPDEVEEEVSEQHNLL